MTVTNPALPLHAVDVERTCLPLEQATMLPGAAYTDYSTSTSGSVPTSSGGGWVCAGHVDQVGARGKFLTLDVGGENVFVIGDDDGLPRAFLNTCRHRGARLLIAPEGSTRRIQCSYHAWTYGLRRQPQERARSPTAWSTSTRSASRCTRSGSRSSRASCCSTSPARRRRRRTTSATSRRCWRKYRNADLKRGARIVYDVDANWKAIGENYSECLHCPGVHPELNRLSHYLSGETISGSGHWCGGSMTLAEGVEDMTVDGARTRKPIDGVDVRSILYFLIFPNTLVSLHPDYVMLHTLWPKAPDRTEVVCEWFFEPEAIEAPRLRPVRRRRVLGPGQPRGLARLRAHPAGDGVALVHPGPLHDAGGRRARVRRDDRPALPRRPSMSSSNGHRPTDFDAIVVGGGHNGLTAAAYLARAGLKVCVLERRDLLGGACVTEEIWPGRRVSRASYVVSMLRPQVVKDLELKRFGYDPIPLDPPFATFAADGTPILFHNDEAKARESLARVSPKDAAIMPEFEAMMERVADVLRPMMLKPPPALGSKHPGDVLELLREAGRAAGLSRRGLQELYRVMTMSVGDLLDDWFVNDALKGAYASTGVVGVWAGPRSPGTAYNLLHHELGELDGVGGAWGHVRGGMGAISESIAASARAHGATIRTGAAVTSIDVRDGRTHGVTLDGRRDDQRADRALGRAPEDDRPGPRRRRALPRGGRHRHGALPQPRRLREGQLDPVRAAALQRSAARPHARSRSARASTTSSAPGRTRRSASPPRTRTSRSRSRRRSTRR